MRLKGYLNIPQGFIAHVFDDWDFFLDEKGDISSKGCVSVGIWPNLKTGSLRKTSQPDIEVAHLNFLISKKRSGFHTFCLLVFIPG